MATNSRHCSQATPPWRGSRRQRPLGCPGRAVPNQHELVELILGAETDPGRVRRCSGGRRGPTSRLARRPAGAHRRRRRRRLCTAASGRVFRAAQGGRAAAGPGAAPDAVAANGTALRALNSAAAGGHHSIAHLLLDHGAEVDPRQTGGFTPLHEAAHQATSSWCTCCSSAAQILERRPTTARPRPTSPASPSERPRAPRATARSCHIRVPCHACRPTDSSIIDRRRGRGGGPVTVRSRRGGAAPATGPHSEPP